MIVLMEPTATAGEVADVVERLSAAGCRIRRLGGARAVLAVVAPDAGAVAGVAGSPGVERILAGGPEQGLVSRALRAEPSRVELGGGVSAGGRDLLFLVRAPALADRDELERVAAGAAAAGAHGLVGGDRPAGRQPDTATGGYEDVFSELRRSADAHGLLLAGRVPEPGVIALAAQYCDVLRVAAGDMYDYSLLTELGRTRRPVLLERAAAATITEWLGAAEYLLAAGNPDVILCERGVRGFDARSADVLDLAAVAVLEAESHLPVLVAPGRGTGAYEDVGPMARAAVAAGADGLVLDWPVPTGRAGAADAPDAAGSELADAVRSVLRVAAAVGRGR